jgi:hypothetical protein
MKKKVFYIVTFIALLISSVIAVISFYSGNYDICVYSSLIAGLSFFALLFVYSWTANWPVEGGSCDSSYV